MFLIIFCQVIFSFSFIHFHSISHPSSNRHLLNFIDDNKYQIKARVLSKDDENKRFLKLQLKIKEIDKEKNIKGKLKLIILNPQKNIELNDEISFSAKIKEFKNFNNPDSFNYKRYMNHQNLWAYAYLKDKFITIDKKGKQSIIKKLQDKIKKNIDKVQNFADAKAVLKTFILGKKQNLSSDLKEIFIKTGTIHIFAISGLHIGIVFGSFFFIIAFFLSRFEFLLLHTNIKKIALFLSYFIALLYFLISGMSPSSQRAFLMLSFFVLSFYIEKKQNIINIIFLVAFFILCIFPQMIFNISFLLSFITVFFIILSKQSADKFFKEKNIKSFYKKTYTFLIISLTASFSSIPLIAYFFNRISLFAFLSNIICIILISFVILPISFITVFLSLFGISLIKLNCIIIDIFLKLVKLLSYLPFNSIMVIKPSVFELLCFYLILLIIFLIFLSQKKAFKKKALIFLSFVIFFLAIEISVVFHKRFFSKKLIITILDVRHGSSALIEIPGGKRVLIDGGGFSNNEYFDMGKIILTPFLLSKKIKTIDYVFLSHPESDHLNGLLYILKNFNVKNVYTNNEEAKSFAYKTFLEIIDEKNINFPQYKTIDKVFFIDKVKFEILYPPKDFKKKEEKWRNFNNNSLVLKLSYQDKSVLFAGDIMKKAEKELILLSETAGISLKSDILISPHHGSTSSNTKKFAEKIQPNFLIISKGGFRKISKKVINNFKKTKILSTDAHGAITIEIDKNKIICKKTIEKCRNIY